MTTDEAIALAEKYNIIIVQDGSQRCMVGHPASNIGCWATVGDEESINKAIQYVAEQLDARKRN